MPLMEVEKMMSSSFGLSYAEKEMIKTTWEIVNDVDELMSDLYNHLFYFHPDLRPLFKENLRSQGCQFCNHINQLIRNIHQLNGIEYATADIRMFYAGYNFNSQDYICIE